MSQQSQSNDISSGVSVCIVNRNAVAMLRDCLTAVYGASSELELDVIVVDNGSNDGSAQMVSTEFPRVTLLCNQANTGFAQSNNQAIRAAKGDVIVLLNNDTVAQPGALSALRRALNEPSVAIAGGHLLNTDGSTQLGYYKIDLPTAGSLIRELFFVDQWWPANPWHKRTGAARFDAHRAQEAGQLPGACLAIRRDFLNKTGLLDERFFFWYEDVELCHRAWETGWKVIYVPEARVIHFGGASFDAVKLSEKSRWRYTSMSKYIALTFPPFQAAVAKIAIIVSLLVRVPAFFAAGIVTGNRRWFSAARASSTILQDVVLGR